MTEETPAPAPGNMIIGGFAVGERFVAPRRTVTEALLETMTALGGYTHPLFADATYVRDHTPFERTPVPGALTLFLLGGMAEQTGRFNAVIAMLGIDDVRFPEPALVGDTLELTISVRDARPSSSGRTGIVTVEWDCRSDRGAHVLDATVTFLVALEGT